MADILTWPYSKQTAPHGEATHVSLSKLTPFHTLATVMTAGAIAFAPVVLNAESRHEEHEHVQVTPTQPAITNGYFIIDGHRYLYVKDKNTTRFHIIGETVPTQLDPEIISGVYTELPKGLVDEQVTVAIPALDNALISFSMKAGHTIKPDDSDPEKDLETLNAVSPQTLTLPAGFKDKPRNVQVFTTQQNTIILEGSDPSKFVESAPISDHFPGLEKVGQKSLDDVKNTVSYRVYHHKPPKDHPFFSAMYSVGRFVTAPIWVPIGWIKYKIQGAPAPHIPESTEHNSKRILYAGHLPPQKLNEAVASAFKNMPADLAAINNPNAVLVAAKAPANDVTPVQTSAAIAAPIESPNVTLVASAQKQSPDEITAAPVLVAQQTPVDEAEAPVVSKTDEIVPAPVLVAAKAPEEIVAAPVVSKTDEIVLEPVLVAAKTSEEVAPMPASTTAKTTTQPAFKIEPLTIASLSKPKTIDELFPLMAKSPLNMDFNAMAFSARPAQIASTQTTNIARLQQPEGAISRPYRLRQGHPTFTFEAPVVSNNNKIVPNNVLLASYASTSAPAAHNTKAASVLTSGKKAPLGGWGTNMLLVSGVALMSGYSWYARQQQKQKQAQLNQPKKGLRLAEQKALLAGSAVGVSAIAVSSVLADQPKSSRKSWAPRLLPSVASFATGAGVRMGFKFGLAKIAICSTAMAAHPIIAAMVLGAAVGLATSAVRTSLRKGPKNWKKELLKGAAYGAGFGLLGFEIESFTHVGEHVGHLFSKAKDWVCSSHHFGAHAADAVSGMHPAHVAAPQLHHDIASANDVGTAAHGAATNLIADAPKSFLTEDQFQHLPKALQKLAESQNKEDWVKLCQKMSEKIILTHPHDQTMLKMAGEWMKHGVKIADDFHIQGVASQQLHANMAYAEAWGKFGIEKNVGKAIEAARMSGHVMNNYGARLLKLLHAPAAG